MAIVGVCYQLKAGLLEACDAERLLELRAKRLPGEIIDQQAASVHSVVAVVPAKYLAALQG